MFFLFGRRIEKSFVDFENGKKSYVKKFVYDREDILMETDGDGRVMAVYFHGPGIDNPLGFARDLNDNGTIDTYEKFSYVKDYQGSIRVILDYQGRLIQEYEYSSYGKTRVTMVDGAGQENLIDQPYGYTSREFDREVGLYFYRARYYNPGSGRFISSDPIGFSGGDMNTYRYSGNNSVNLKDPSGKGPVAYAGCLGASFLGAFIASIPSLINYSDLIELNNDEIKNKLHLIKGLENQNNSCSSEQKMENDAFISDLGNDIHILKSKGAMLNAKLFGTAAAGMSGVGIMNKVCSYFLLAPTL